MLKNLVILLAVVGFVSTSLALGAAPRAAAKPAQPAKGKEVEVRGKEKGKEAETAEKNAQKAKEDNTANRIAEKTTQLSKAGLTPEQFAIVQNEGTRNKLNQMIEQYKDNVEDENSFVVRASSILIRRASKSSDVDQKQILKIVDETFGLMALGGKEGMAARTVISVLARELGAGKSTKLAVRTAITEGFPELKGKELEDKIDDFTRNCMQANA